MRSYVESELPGLVTEHFPIDVRSDQGSPAIPWAATVRSPSRCAIPTASARVSAFAPICAPSLVERRREVLARYLGDDLSAMREYDAVALIEDGARLPELLVDQGTQDEFLSWLGPEKLKAACKAAGMDLTLRMQEGYDHAYYFVSTFMADHIAWHAERLKA
jgi:S-formylglutathione hydrolase